MQVSKREKLILKWFREANPRDELTIRKDKDGRPDKGWVSRSQGISLDDNKSLSNELGL